MKWIIQNKPAYLMIKAIQICIAMTILTATIILRNGWVKSDPDNHLHIVVRLSIMMLIFDVAVYLCDLSVALAVKRFILHFRFIICSLSFCTGLIIQVTTFDNIYNSNKVEIDFRDNMEKFSLFIIFYTYQCYLVWAVINLLMYFQIKQMEHFENKEKRRVTEISKLS